MSSRTNGRIRSSGVAAAALLVIVAASCTGGSDDAPAADSAVPATDVATTDDDSFTANSGVVSAPTTLPLPDCDGEAVTVPADWPYGVAEVIVPTAVTRDGDLFLVQGVTNQPEVALTSTMDDSFTGFDISEPTGGDNDISVRFTALNGTGDLRMSDDDTDGCWDVELAALFEPGIAPPVDEAAGSAPDAEAATDPSTPGTTQPGDDPEAPGTTVGNGVPAVASTVAPPEVIDPLDVANAVGAGEVITGRSTFQVQITTCRLEPLLIEGVAVGGTLVIEGDPSSVTTTWTYDDGVVISSTESKVLGLDARGGSVVADGQNAEGPETIFATFLCTDP